MNTTQISPDDVGDVARRLKQLSDDEKLVLRLRFALDGSYYHTLDDIAAGLHVDQDQVRAIELRGLAKLNGTLSNGEGI